MIFREAKQHGRSLNTAKEGTGGWADAAAAGDATYAPKDNADDADDDTYADDTNDGDDADNAIHTSDVTYANDDGDDANSRLSQARIHVSLFI